MPILDHLWIIMALPLLGAAVNGLLGKNWSKPAVNTVGIGSIGLSLTLQHASEGLCERVSVARPSRRYVVAILDDKGRRRIFHRITLQARSLSTIVRICPGDIAEILRACKQARHFLLH